MPRTRDSYDRSFTCPIAFAAHSLPFWCDPRVLLAVLVALRTVRYGSLVMVLAAGVLACRNGFHVGWVAAGAVPAQVIQLQPFWDFLIVGVFPHEPVCHSLWMAWSPSVLPIPIWGFGAGPFPAFRVWDFADFPLHAPILARI